MSISVYYLGQYCPKSEISVLPRSELEVNALLEDQSIVNRVDPVHLYITPTSGTRGEHGHRRLCSDHTVDIVAAYDDTVRTQM